MTDLKVVFGLLVFIAFLGLMFTGLLVSELTEEDYTKCIPSINNLGGLLLIMNAEASCKPSAWIGTIFIVPLVIALAVYITPAIGN